jgi:hypothetical protein
MKLIINIGTFILIVICLNVLQTVFTPINIIVLYSAVQIYRTRAIINPALIVLSSSLIQDTLSIVPLFTFAFLWVVVMFPVYYIFRTAEELLKNLQPIIKISITSIFLATTMLSHSVLMKIIAGTGRSLSVQNILITCIVCLIISFMLEKQKQKAQAIY